MKRFCILLMLPLLATGCGKDSAEMIGTELVAAKRELVKIIAGVTDEVSAKAAAPQIQAVYARFADLTKRAAGLPDAPREIADRLDNEFMAADEEVKKSLRTLATKDAKAEAIVRDIMSSEIRKLPNP